MLYGMADNNVEILAKRDGALYNFLTGNQDYVFEGIGDEFEITSSTSSFLITLGNGEGVVGGRHVTEVTENDTNSSIQLEANSTGYVVIRFDLTQPSGSEAYLYATPTLVQHDLNNQGTIRDLPLYSYVTNSNGVTSFIDVRNISSGSNVILDIGTDGKIYANYTYEGNKVKKRLGSLDPAELTATPAQVLSGYKFGGKGSDDPQIGTIVDRGTAQDGTGIGSFGDSDSNRVITINGLPEGYYHKDATSPASWQPEARIAASKFGNAQPENVLSGKTFTSIAGSKSGTMPSNSYGINSTRLGKNSKGVYVYFPYGYYPGYPDEPAQSWVQIPESQIGNAPANKVAADVTFTSHVAGPVVRGTLPYASGRSSYQFTKDNSTPVMIGDNQFWTNPWNRTTSSNVGSNYVCIRWHGEPFYCNANVLFAAPATNFGDATQAQVLSGKTFTSTAGLKVSGTMPSRSSGVQATSTGTDSTGRYVYFPYGYYPQTNTTYGAYVYMNTFEQEKWLTPGSSQTVISADSGKILKSVTVGGISGQVTGSGTGTATVTVNAKVFSIAADGDGYDGEASGTLQVLISGESSWRTCNSTNGYYASKAYKKSLDVNSAVYMWKNNSLKDYTISQARFVNSDSSRTANIIVFKAD